jgi:hypothetical protein
MLLSLGESGLKLKPWRVLSRITRSIGILRYILPSRHVFLSPHRIDAHRCLSCVYHCNHGSFEPAYPGLMCIYAAKPFSISTSSGTSISATLTNSLGPTAWSSVIFR